MSEVSNEAAGKAVAQAGVVHGGVHIHRSRTCTLCLLVLLCVVLLLSRRRE